MTSVYSDLIPLQTWQSQKQQDARNRSVAAFEDTLTPEEQQEFEILNFCASLYDQGRKARQPYETFDMAWDLYMGNVWPNRWPSWRPKVTINKIRAFITFMQAVMTDNKPRFAVEPMLPGSENASDLLRKLTDRDWDENDLQRKTSIFALYGLIWGTGIMKVFYDPYADNGRGKHMSVPVVPYRIYVNRTATCVDDAEFLIHIDEKTMGWIRRNFPEKAGKVYTLRGVTATDERDPLRRDYIREGDSQEVQRIVTAQNVDGNITGPMMAHPNPQYHDRDKEEVEVGEWWYLDETLEPYKRQQYENGKYLTEPIVKGDGSYDLQTVRYENRISTIDGKSFPYPIRKPREKPVMETAWRWKYPNGRLTMIAGGRVLLRDIPNPFQISGFPFASWKDYDVDAFWGHGETIALKDCQISLNKVASQVYNILEKTGNPSFKVQKGAGVNLQTIKDKPGLLIAMDDIKAMEPLDKPPMPREFLELYNILRGAMAEVAGLNDATMGRMTGDNQSFAMIDSLQESGAAPLRLKVRNFESGLTRIGKLRVQLIQQFDRGQRPLREKTEYPPGTVQSSGAVEAQFRQYTNTDLQGAVEFKIVPVSSLSTSPASVWSKWMELYKSHLIDRRWWHEKNRIEGYRTELPRLEKQEAMDAEQAAIAKDKEKSSKPGPQPKTSRTTRRNRPPGQSRGEQSMIR
ncbi:MAG: hypothetical protein WCB99_08880 [Candidatus Cybelea sp.]